MQRTQVAVEPIGAGGEFIVGAGFDDLAPIDYRDPIDVANRREAMCDHEGRAALHEVVERLLD